MREKDNDPLSVNQIAALLDVDFWRVRYVVNARRCIKPAVIVQAMRFYDAKGIAKINTELKAIESRRSRHQHVNPVGSGAAANPVTSV